MKRYTCLFAWLLSVGMVVPAVAQRSRYPVTAAEVAGALSRMGIQVSPDRIVFLSNVVANEEDPQLKIKSIELGEDRSGSVRLACTHSEQCLPFVVELRPKSQGVSAAPKQVRTYRTAPQIQRPEPPVQRPAPGPDVRWNSQAVLVIVAPHMQIRIPVICMQNGSVGQTIRVTSPDHRQSYNAEVVGRGLLRGNL